ncbi:MAG: transporter substrate-binding domain-containing protein [Oscillospiraceae bacterium]|nr:transporter substrate-binding domain-containing protein [Oscillospiraceae bacterium]
MLNTKKRVFLSMLAVSALLLSSCGLNSKKVHSIDDLEGKLIGVQLGTTAESLAKEVDDSRVELYEKAADAIQSLKQGKIDAVIVDLETAQAFVDVNPNIVMLDEQFPEEKYAIAIPMGQTKLRSQINEALRKLTDDGTMENIKLNYEGDEKGEHPYQRKEGERRNGTLVMATNAEFPPYEDVYANEFVGFDIDMMNAVCDYLDMDLQIKDMEFDHIISAVKTKEVDVGVAALSVTEDREKDVLFSDNYAVTHQVVIVRK